MKAEGTTALARLLREFFADHLPRIRGVSPNTVHSYRDAWALLLRFLAIRHDRPVIHLELSDLGPDDVLAFLDNLELARGNGPITRNSRLAAIHAFARYAAAGDPEHLERCQRLLAIPFKRAPKRAVEYLEADEVAAILAAPDRSTCDGRRDFALLLTMFNTGARVQEIVDIRIVDLQLVRPQQVLLHGKGRKERICPLWPQTAEVLAALIEEGGSRKPLFCNQRGQALTRFGARYLLAKYVARAKSEAPSLKSKRIHPHTMRHTTAVHLLQAGVDLVTISHWLGHASVETTNRYAAIDMEMKRTALAKVGTISQLDAGVSNWRNDKSILDWLESL
jgi:site-specific recombinase XerD